MVNQPEVVKSNIERDIETVRAEVQHAYPLKGFRWERERNTEALYALDRLSTELSRLRRDNAMYFQAAEDAGLRADRNSDYVAKLHVEIARLRAIESAARQHIKGCATGKYSTTLLALLSPEGEPLPHPGV